MANCPTDFGKDRGLEFDGVALEATKWNSNNNFVKFEVAFISPDKHFRVFSFVALALDTRYRCREMYVGME